jgi:hypothetical protein
MEYFIMISKTQKKKMTKVPFYSETLKYIYPSRTSQILEDMYFWRNSFL